MTGGNEFCGTTPCTTDLRCADAGRDAMQDPSGEGTEAMSHARRDVARSREGEPPRLEARLVFGGGDQRAHPPSLGGVW